MMRNAVVLVAAVTVCVVGCKKGGEGKAPGEEPGKRTITVGFSQIGAESAWRTAETQSIREEAKKRGVNLKFSDAQNKQENQIRALKSFIAQGVDAIILAPVVETGWEPVLREAKRAGIPVVLVDRGIKVSDESLFATLIASDFVEEGRRAGRWLAEKMKGKAKIVQLEGTAGSDPANDRAKGFKEIIDEYPGMTIIHSQTADFRRSEGKKVMANIINAKGKEIEAVYAHNDDMALGAIQALEEAGMKPGTDVIVVSIDAVHDAFQAMIDGKLNCTVECNPLLGPQAFDAIEHLLFRRVIVQDSLFTQGTAAEDIKTRKY